MKRGLLGLFLVAGCSSHTAWHASAGHPHPNAQVHIHGGAALATVVGISALAAGAYQYESSRSVPQMAPDRKVSEQDCTKPLDYTLGNIRCK